MIDGYKNQYLRTRDLCDSRTTYILTWSYLYWHYWPVLETPMKFLDISRLLLCKIWPHYLTSESTLVTNKSTSFHRATETLNYISNCAIWQLWYFNLRNLEAFSMNSETKELGNWHHHFWETCLIKNVVYLSKPKILRDYQSTWHINSRFGKLVHSGFWAPENHLESL